VLFGADLAKFVREGNTRELFKGREVVSLLTGEPEYLDPLKDETPNGWIVTGYPWNGINTPEHKDLSWRRTRRSTTTTRAWARWWAMR
jgi:branched-chain amino acid transport system substrate-binding protein